MRGQGTQPVPARPAVLGRGRRERRHHRAATRGLLVVGLHLLPFPLAAQAQEADEPAPAPAPTAPGAPTQRGEPAPSPVPGGAAQPPAPRPSPTARRVAAGESLEVAQAQPADDLAPGTIAVEVSEVDGAPVAGQRVRIGILQSLGGGRDETTGQTDAAGRAVFTGLETGTGQAYRVTVAHQGASYGSTPFQLPTDRGYAVRILQLPTTRQTDTVIESLGLSAVELKDQRLHVTQRSTLMNFGEETVVFGDDGVRFELPEGFLAFQSQPVMTDQRLVAQDDGFRLKGSLPPGQVTLTWTFDVPLEAGSQDLRLPSPFRTFRYRVIAEASPEMGLLVDDLPEASPVQRDGRRFLVTEIQRRPADPPLDTVYLRITGIPGPGPGRWVAVGLAALLAVVGLVAAVRRPRRSTEPRLRALAARRARLLAEAADLERAAQAEEVGPNYHARESERIVQELAELLRQEREERRELDEGPASRGRDATTLAAGSKSAPTP